jgi:Matrixin
MVVTYLHSRTISTLLLAGSLYCVSPAYGRTHERMDSNWASADTPCAKHDDLRASVLGNIGVKIDVADEWADGFRRALSFWNMVLAAHFYEEPNLDFCTIRIIYGGPDILNRAFVARSQVTDWVGFFGKIAVRKLAAQELSRGEIYGIAVHEIGHILGLKHSTSIHSVMFFLNVDGTEALDAKDILDLSRRHKVRPEMFEMGFLPLEAVGTDDPRNKRSGGD